MKRHIIVVFFILCGVGFTHLTIAQDVPSPDYLAEAQQKVAEQDWAGAKVAYTQYIVQYPKKPEGY
ncbi:MAG: hypothetical protein AAF223_22985, partial [Bacteroidota bacterium]